jgi:hypothetical protein
MQSTGKCFLYVADPKVLHQFQRTFQRFWCVCITGIQYAFCSLYGFEYNAEKDNAEKSVESMYNVRTYIHNKRMHVRCTRKDFIIDKCILLTSWRDFVKVQKFIKNFGSRRTNRTVEHVNKAFTCSNNWSRRIFTQRPCLCKNFPIYCTTYEKHLPFSRLIFPTKRMLKWFYFTIWTLDLDFVIFSPYFLICQRFLKAF